jgi:AcrR family transcriptional regulator
MKSATPRPARTAYHHGDLRTQLVAAVRDLVEAHGPEGFSIAQAARVAGVSSAAPYKHFKDRPEILRAVAGEGLDALRERMEKAARTHGAGSPERIAAIGQAYVDFARASPGVFRLIFGLTEGHEENPALAAKGKACFEVVLRATADALGCPFDDPSPQLLAYILWSSVHGHAFLTIDRKTAGVDAQMDDRTYLMAVATAVLGGSTGPRQIAR